MTGRTNPRYPLAGHAAFALEADGTTVLIDPFLTGNPKAAASADEVDADAILLTHGHGDHYRRHRRDRQAHRRHGRRDHRARARARRRARRGPRRLRPEHRRHGRASTGARCALVPAWHTSTTPKGTVNTPGRARHRARRQARLPPRRHGLFSDLAARQALRRASTSRSCRSAATTRWTASTRSSPRSGSARTDHPVPLRHVPADRDRRRRRSSPTCRTPARPRSRPRPGRHAHAMTTAVVLIEAERDALQTLGGQLADLDGVAEAYSVTGEWDFVAIVRVPRHEMLADVVTGELVKLPGREPDADDGGLRGLLAPRPRGDVLDRGLGRRRIPGGLTRLPGAAESSARLPAACGRQTCAGPAPRRERSR